MPRKIEKVVVVVIVAAVVFGKDLFSGEIAPVIARAISVDESVATGIGDGQEPTFCAGNDARKLLDENSWRVENA